jgi:hypothetical protein
MKHNVFLAILLAVLVLYFVPANAVAQKTKIKGKPKTVRSQQEKQTKSFIVKNIENSEIKLNLSSEPIKPKDLIKVPEHRYVQVPIGPKVPNKYTSTEINLLNLRAEPSIIKNVLVMPTGARPDQVAEPTVAVKGDFIFYTANHFAAFSSDGGQNFTYVSPWQAFNGTPYEFCCDQVAVYIPKIDMIVWSLQALSYRVQLILYATPENARQGVWRKILFTPSNLGVPGGELDYTDMSFGDNMLYWSTNVFSSENSSVVVRIPLEGLKNGNPQPRASGRRWGVRLVQNTGNVGYFAAHVNTSTLRVYSWAETADEPTWKDVTVPSWNHAVGWGPVGSRVVGATKAGNDLWFAWNANERTLDRPTKYAQVARVNAQDFTLIDSPDLWNGDFRIGIPALATNTLNNEIGVSYVFGRNHNHGVGLLTGSRVFFTTSQGSFDVAGSRWGDYLCIRQLYDNTGTPQPPGLFAATGYTMTSNSVVQPRLILFGR